jgi:hypothetical protein
MTLSMIIMLFFGVLLVGAHISWEIGADRLLASFRRLVIRVATLGRIRLSAPADSSAAIGVAVITLLMIFISFVIITSRVR